MIIEKIKKEKEKQNLTNEQLAQKANLPIGTVNKILSGETKEPGVYKIEAIRKALGIEEREELKLTKEELEILKNYNELTEEGKKFIKSNIEFAKQHYKEKEEFLKECDNTRRA